MDLAREIGGRIKTRSGRTVDLKNAKLKLQIEIEKEESLITVNRDDFKIILCDLKSFNERYNNFGEEINLRKEMFGSLTLKTSSMLFLRKINQSNFSNVLKYEDKNKIQIMLKDYNFILEFKDY